MSQGNGYWVKGKRVVDVTTSKHIVFLNEHPEKFGLTLRKVKQVHKKYGEKQGTENKAREELIKLGCRSGWVRVRHHAGKLDYWSIEFDDRAKRKKTVVNFVRYAIRHNLMSKYDELRLAGLDDGTREEYSYIAGGATELLRVAQRSEAKIKGQSNKHV